MQDSAWFNVQASNIFLFSLSGLENNKGKPEKVAPAVPKKLHGIKIRKGQDDVNPLEEAKVAKCGHLEEHSGV